MVGLLRDRHFIKAAALLSDERLTEDVRLHIADRNYDYVH